MSKPTRPVKSPPSRPGATRTFFVTSSTWERRSLFRSERMARLFLDVFSEHRLQGRYLLHELVVMPDHFHLLISVPPGMRLEKAVQFIKGGFSYRAAKDLGFHAEVWQRGFSDEYVADADAYDAQGRYIHRNPVEAGLARDAAEYPYSSACPGFQLDPMPEHLSG
jgi:putative transposase